MESTAHRKEDFQPEEVKGVQAAPPEPKAPADLPKPKSAQPDAQTAASKAPAPEGDTGDKSEPAPNAEASPPPPTTLRQEIQASALIAQQVKLVNQEIRNSFQFDDPTSRFDVFSPEMAKELPISEEKEDAERHLLAKEVIHELGERLQQYRVLCLHGEPNIGKSSTAVYLAHRLRLTQHNLDRPALLVPALDRRVRIDLQGLCRNANEFGRRVLLFPDFLSRGNRDVKDFLARLDDKLLSTFSSGLATIESFVIFTAADRTIIDEIHALRLVGIAVELNAPDEGVLRNALNQTLTGCGFTTTFTEDQTLEVVRLARTVPRIVHFVRDFAPLVQSGLTVSDAFKRIDDLEGWFLRELTTIPDAWRFVFTLGVAQALSYEEGVPWAEFGQLLAVLTSCVVRTTGKTESQESYSKDRISEDHLLQNGRASIARDPATASHIVRFNDPTYPQRLWAIITRHNRVLLAACYPALLELADRKDNTLITVRALRIIGRLGEIDPASYLWPLIDKWSAEPGFAFHAKVGLVFEGAFASDDLLYVKACEQRLRTLASAEDKGPALAAVSVCRQIGARRLELCLEILRQVAERSLTKPLEDTQRIEKLLMRIERERITENHGPDASLVLDVYRELLGELGRRIYAEQIPFLISLQFALTSLFLDADFAPLARGLHQWAIENASLAALLSLLYLSPGGIGDELFHEPSEDAKNSSAVQRENPIVRSLIARRENTSEFVDLLEDLYYGFQKYFPPSTTRHFREAYFAYLRKLIKTVVIKEPSAEPGLRNVLAKLLRSMNHDLRMMCHQFLTNDEAITEDDRLSKFAASTLQHGLLGVVNAPKPFAQLVQS